MKEKVQTLLRRWIKTDTMHQTIVLEQQKSAFKMQEEIEKIKKLKLEKANQLYKLVEFGRLSSGLFHDLMNPLTHLVLEINQFSKNNTIQNKNLQEALSSVLQSTQRIDNIIITAKKYIQTSDYSEQFSLNSEIMASIETLRHSTTEHDITILTYMPEEITWYGNTFRFNHVITNILANAIDAYASVPESRRPFVISINLRKEDTAIILSITDSGCGMTDEVLNSIFDPFFTTKAADVGSGIGLSNTKQIIEDNFKGTLTVQSAVNKGSTFTITLPRE